MFTIVRAAVVAACVVVLLEPPSSASQRRKKKEVEVTQTLELPPEPPLAVTAETAKLAFLIAPMSAKGLLSQQTRDGLKALLASARNAQVVRVRAFVAGTGDLRRVPAIVSEVFTERRLKLPVLTVAQVGALPLEGAQVQLEAVLQEKKAVNPHGVVFVAAEAESVPLAMAHLRAAAGAKPDEMLHAACILPSLDRASELRAQMAAAAPRAVLSLAQAQRSPAVPTVACEGVARTSAAAQGGVRHSAGAVFVSAPRLVFAGAQLAFRYQEDDARLAFQRLEKTLAASGTSLKSAVVLNAYPLSPQLAGLVRRVRSEFLDAARPPAGVVVPLEGLPSMDASFALEAVAVIPVN